MAAGAAAEAAVAEAGAVASPGWSSTAGVPPGGCKEGFGGFGLGALDALLRAVPNSVGGPGAGRPTGLPAGLCLPAASEGRFARFGFGSILAGLPFPAVRAGTLGWGGLGEALRGLLPRPFLLGSSMGLSVAGRRTQNVKQALLAPFACNERLGREKSR